MPEHLMFLRFIQLHVEAMEEQETPETNNKTNTKMKAKAKPVAAPATVPVDMGIEESDEEWQTEVPVGVTQMELMNMQNRMAEMETVMQQVLHHLTNAQQNANQ